MTIAEQNDIRLEALGLGDRTRYGTPEHDAVMDFLIEEAWLLDHELLNDWIGLLAEDITYFMPVRQTVLRRSGPGFHAKMGHYHDDLPSLSLRVRRYMTTESAHAEDPPSRTRRYVTNVRVHATDMPGEWAATSSLLLVRSRWDQPTYDLVSAERHDVLRETKAGFKLARRVVYVDSATLGTPNLSVLL
jgi:3-phenylpropionate/cinnamic acid dioxygenase small subunit